MPSISDRASLARGGVFLLIIIALAWSSPSVAQELISTRWRLSGSGALEVSNPVAFGNGRFLYDKWQPFFSDWTTLVAKGEAGVLDPIMDLGPFALAPLLCHGAGGACALDECSRRMDKLSIDRTSFGFAAGLRGDVMLDLLRVQELCKTDLQCATYALEGFVSAEGDSFVRAAAVTELARRGNATVRGPYQPTPRNGITDVRPILRSLPQGWTWVVGLDCSRVPSLSRWLRAWRDLCMRFGSHGDVQGGGALDPRELAEAQRRMDLPGQLPAELGRLFGNWRSDYLVIAGYEGGQWVASISGEFSVKGIKRGLPELGQPVHAEEEAEFSVRLGGISVEVAAHLLTLRSAGAPAAAAQSDESKLFHLAASSECWVSVADVAKLGIPAAQGAAVSAVLNSGVISGRVVGEGARRCVDLWKDFRAALDCSPTAQLTERVQVREVMAAPAGILERERILLAWRRIVQAVEWEADGDAARWSVNLSKFDDVDLMRLMAVWPSMVPRVLSRRD